jgi:IS5 family transposase
MHLIDKHMYPKNFFFAITRDGIDGRRSLLLEGRARRRRSSASASAGAPAGVGSRPKASAEERGEGAVPVADEEQARLTAEEQPAADSGRKSPEKQPEQPDHEMEDLSSAMSALRFVPMSVRFGRGKKSGFAKQ